MASLTDYVRVSQRERRIEHYARQPDGAWSPRDHGAGPTLAIASLGVALPVDEVYLEVFDA